VVSPVQIGRDGELEQLRHFAEHFSPVLIGGPAGVGKSRLAAEALRVGTDRGMTVLLGHCASEGALAYEPIANALRRLTRTFNREELVSLFSGTALLSAALLPEVARIVNVPHEARELVEIYSAVWTLLDRVSKTAPVLLLLEDLHWADSDTYKLLTYLIRERASLPVWIVGTYRTDELHRRHPLTATLLELTRGHLVDELRLQPLSVDELGAMISAIFNGEAISNDLVDALYERTRGNPFFAEELIKVLLERGDIFRGTDSWERRAVLEIEMPDSVRDTLLARLRTLDEQTLRVLRLAAVAGEQLEVATLVEASGLSAEVIDDVLREGLNLQLLVERRDDAAPRYAFRHALTREALADELVGPDRQHAHQRIAQALAIVHRDDLDPVCAQMADHFSEVGDVAQSVEFNLRAARYAVASFALEEAARRFEWALRHVPDSAPTRLDLLIEAANALIELPERRWAVAFANEALDVARRAGRPRDEVHALEVLGRDAYDSGDTPRSLALLSEMSVLIHDLDPYEEALVVARTARLMIFMSRFDEAEETIVRGIALATKCENYEALSLLHGSRILMTQEGSDFEESLELSLSAARAAHNPFLETQLITNVGYNSLWTGNLERAGEFLERGASWCDANLPYNRYPEAGLAWLLSLTGQYERSRVLASVLRRHGHIPTRVVALTALCEVAERTGDDDYDLIIDELRSVALGYGEAQRMVPALATLAHWALANEELDGAKTRFWHVLEASTTVLGLGSHWLFSPDLAASLATAGRLDDLVAWDTAIGNLTSRDANAHNRAANTLVHAHTLALRREFDEARTNFQDAAQRYHQLPCPAREAESYLGLADLEWRVGDSAANRSALARASAIASDLGATTLAHQAAEALGFALAPTVLTTVLFTDIVASTEHLGAVGDHVWRAELERHNVTVRRELERHAGREVNTTGDGFLASFESPAHAVRCALAVRDALKSSGLDVRAGLHTGECQIVGANLSGMAVHIAARVSARANSGQVLVSSTVRDLVVGSTLAFNDLGAHKLRGVTGEWRLYEAFANVP